MKWDGWSWRMQVERVSYREETNRKAAMAAYVTFRMTLAGHAGLLPHQFCCCSRGQRIASAHLCTKEHTLHTQPWLYLGEHTRSLQLAADCHHHSPRSPASKTLLGNRESELLTPQTTSAATIPSTLTFLSIIEMLPHGSIGEDVQWDTEGITIALVSGDVAHLTPSMFNIKRFCIIVGQNINKITHRIRRL